MPSSVCQVPAASRRPERFATFIAARSRLAHHRSDEINRRHPCGARGTAGDPHLDSAPSRFSRISRCSRAAGSPTRSRCAISRGASSAAPAPTSRSTDWARASTSRPSCFIADKSEKALRRRAATRLFANRHRARARRQSLVIERNLATLPTLVAAVVRPPSGRMAGPSRPRISPALRPGHDGDAAAVRLFGHRRALARSSAPCGGEAAVAA